MKGRPPLRDRVRLERRGERINSATGSDWEEIEERWLEIADDFDPSDDAPGDGAGNTLDEFRQLGPAFMRCDVRELEGGERVIAAKLQGTSTCVVMLRVSQLVNQITTADRFVQLMPNSVERVLAILYAPPAGARDEYRTFMCEDGAGS